MSTTTSNFNIVLPEGSDTFNPLTFNNNAFNRVDEVMKANQDRGITTATHTYIDGVNTILRDVATCNAMVFVASSDYIAGSTIAVDGITCTFRYADGTAPQDKAFATNQAVLCYLNGTILTLLSFRTTTINLVANNVTYDNNTSHLNATNVQNAIDESVDKTSNIVIPKSTTNISCDVVFGDNASSGVYTCSMIPLPNAHQKTITIASARIRGTSEEVPLSVSKASIIGFSLLGTSAVRNKTVSVIFNYS